MAKIKKAVKENVEGDFFIDSTCIDCGTCEIIAPEVFNRADDHHFVAHQPEGEKEMERSMRALLSCPVSAIGTTENDPKPYADLLPFDIGGAVYHTGYHSKKSFGAASYLIVREEGNILVDSPRFVGSLAEKIESLGGIAYIFLTHKDDVADHAKFAKRFGAKRILHKDDMTDDTKEIEMFIEGEGDIDLAPDIKIIPVPGHTKGSCCLLYDDRYLFTGDHLYQNPGRTFPTAFINHCWYSWERQTESMEKLEGYKFEQIVPGHGAGVRYGADIMPDKIAKCVEWMKNKKVIRAFGKHHSWDVGSIAWPDEVNRTTEDIDAKYKGFAIEHTSIDASENQREYSHYFEEKTREIENDFADKLDYRLGITVPYDVAKAKDTWPEIRSWIEEEASSLKEGRHKIEIKAGGVVPIYVCKDSRREPGLFFSRSTPADDSFADRVKELLDRKVKKLATYKDKDTTTILIVESYDIALMSEHILREAIQGYRPNRIDEIWWADTSIKENLRFSKVYNASYKSVKQS